ncbi:hypothetical protein VNO77_43284 [Canavalia gladiata]|uniref:Prolamin-like domain-containing protein n=1 Tax=Canavalia gladiata TaxID=3824 RepID=A0AAN9JXF9_CANGL
MATFNNLCLMIVFMSSATMLVKTGLSSEGFEPSEGPSTERPPTSYEKYLRNCILNLHVPCGYLYTFGTIYFGNGTISKDCCHSIVHDMGKQCHDSLARYILESPKFVNLNRTQILQRSDQIWNKCNHLSAQLDEVHHLASDASSSVQYLKDCAAKLHSPCHGQIILGTFFGNQTLSKDCCHNLVLDLGKPCNDNLTKHVLRSPQFKQNENQILYRTKNPPKWLQLFEYIHLTTSCTEETGLSQMNSPA